MTALTLPVLYLRHSIPGRHTSICFGEYELSPSLISLSPLSTSHPIGFQPELVRPSIECYFNFSLLMDRSPGFASAATDSCALFRLAFATASSLRDLTLPVTSNSPDHYAKGTRSFLTELPQLVSVRFQVLFHSPSGVLFTFPSRYWFTIGHRRVFSLGRWSSQLQAGFHVPRPTRDLDRRVISFAYGGVTRCALPSQTVRLRTRLITPLAYQLASQALQLLCNIGTGPLSCTSLGFSPFARHYSGNDFLSSG